MHPPSLWEMLTVYHVFSADSMIPGGHSENFKKYGERKKEKALGNQSFQGLGGDNRTRIYDLLRGNMVVGSKILNVKGTGSITVHKVYTRNHTRSDAILEGKDVRATIVGKLDDPDAYGAERVALYDVSFDDETIMDFAAGSAGKTSHPFTFGRREWLDTVTA